MSQTHHADPSSHNFQFIFDNALKANKTCTKDDLLFHPLVSQLQACQSLRSILAVLQQQVQELDQSQMSDKRLTKWLEPTITGLYAFSVTIGEGVSPVCLMTWTPLTSRLLYLFGRLLTHKVIFSKAGILLLVRFLFHLIAWATFNLHIPQVRIC